MFKDHRSEQRAAEPGARGPAVLARRGGGRAERRAGRPGPRGMAGRGAAPRPRLRGVPGSQPRAARGHLPGDGAGAASRRYQTRSIFATLCAGGSSTARCTCTATSAAAVRSSRTARRSCSSRPRPRAEHAPSSPRCSEDRLIVTEFLTELTRLEQRVFWLMAEGMRYRAIAPVLEIPVNEARKAARSCERKRERFQLLYDTGRLCGYRAHTIRGAAGRRGDQRGARTRARSRTSRAARSCRAEHKTNARRLRRSFQGQAAALLPIPCSPAAWLARKARCGRAERCSTAWRPTACRRRGRRPRTRARDDRRRRRRGKLAAAGATVAVIAGGTIGATQRSARTGAHRTPLQSRAAPAPRAGQIPSRVTPPRGRPQASASAPARPRADLGASAGAPGRGSPLPSACGRAPLARSANQAGSRTSACRAAPAPRAPPNRRTRPPRAAAGRSAHEPTKFVGRSRPSRS